MLTMLRLLIYVNNIYCSVVAGDRRLQNFIKQSTSGDRRASTADATRAELFTDLDRLTMTASEMLVFIFLASSCAVDAFSDDTPPSVHIPHGTVKGSWLTTENGRSYAAFVGVPYARPPIGKYRFREPQKLKPWTGVWGATRPGPVCLQYDPFVKMITGSENCLFVNVYTPKLRAGPTLPVVIFIHGGAFMYGAGHGYDPVLLMDKDVVAVTLNYRLGPLGFLSTGDEAAPGNAGLKDQAMALRWVRDNIAAFGGDPRSVTLTGCSAGGASVHYHYLSPLSKGTFARGVAFSGSAHASWTHAVKPAQKARTLARLLGCPLDTSRELVECLRFRPAEAVVQGQIDMFDWSIHLFTPFVPTAEPADTREPFLTRYPYHATQSGQMSKLPLVAGVCSEEGLYPAAAYRSAPGILEDLEVHWNELASNIFEYNDTLPVAERATVAAAIKQRYLGGKPVSEETFPQLVQALGDRLFAADVARLVQLHSRSGQPVHLYRYSFRGNKSVSFFMTRNNEDYGVSHGDDITHIWQLPGLEMVQPEDMMMSRNLIDMLYSYAKTGTPQFNGVQWTPVTPGSQEINYLEISGPKQAKMTSSSDFGQRSFWDSLGFVENENFNPHLKDEL